MRIPRLLVASLLAATVVAAPAPTSASDREEQAARIVDRAPDGQPLEVVVTRRAHDGTPVISTVAADTRSAARRIVARALGQRDTVAAEMDTRVSIAAWNDKYRSQQWALTALKAESVYKIATGGKTKKAKQVTVAVVDTGVKASHPDLTGNVLKGRDYISPGTAANDTNGHGTHVAGVIAAKHHNKKGVAGLAPRAKILPVRVLGRTGTGDSSGVAKGILWAVSKGAKVINLSVESRSSSPAMEAAIAEAVRKNVLVVAAAGNGGCGGLLGGNRVTYPAAYPGVVGVGAVTRSLGRASFSSCGRHVDVAAPGADIISTVIKNSVGLGCSASAEYCALSGTSMASPHVAAAGALAISRYGWSLAKVAARLESTARDLAPAGKDTATGAGFLDVQKLLTP